MLSQLVNTMFGGQREICALASNSHSSCDFCLVDTPIK